MAWLTGAAEKATGLPGATGKMDGLTGAAGKATGLTEVMEKAADLTVTVRLWVGALGGDGMISEVLIGEELIFSTSVLTLLRELGWLSWVGLKWIELSGVELN